MVQKMEQTNCTEKNSRPPSDFQSRLFVAIDEFLQAGFCLVDLTANRKKEERSTIHIFSLT